MAINIVKNNLLGSIGKYLQAASALRYSTEMSQTYKTLIITTPKPFVYLVKLNRPEKRNAMNPTMWKEFKECFEGLSMNPDCRVVILSAAGKTFCAGIDLQGMVEMGSSLAEHEDIARRSKLLESKIKDYQDTFTAIEKCSKPVIAAVHGACVGAGMDMISAADIRYASSNAYFQIKEVDIGMAADVGTLQRFPKIVGSDSLVRELIYTARKYPAAEALESGFISRILDNEESLLNKSIEVAEDIASKSPVAVQGSKMSLVYSRDHSVQEGLNHIATHNKAMLQSEDFLNAAMAQAVKVSASQATAIISATSSFVNGSPTSIIDFSKSSFMIYPRFSGSNNWNAFNNSSGSAGLNLGKSLCYYYLFSNALTTYFDDENDFI